MKHEFTIYTCDRCGREDVNPYSRISRRVGIWLFGCMWTKEICKACRREFDDWWSKPTATASTGEGE